MPSARILTRAVEEADFLAEDLRRRGFQVQIVSPDHTPLEPVDLEVTLEECETETALRRVDAHPEAEDLCVFVAPGALTEGNRPMRIVSLTPEVPEAEAEMLSVPIPPTLPAENPALQESSQEEAIGVEPNASAEAELPESIVPEIPEEAPAMIAAAWKEKTATPEAVTIGVASKEAAGKLLTWGKRFSANKKALRQTAILAAFCAAGAVWWMVLGATAHRITPIASVPAAFAETSAVPMAKPVATQAVPADPTPAPVVKESSVPGKSAPKVRTKSRIVAHNPEEDVVAKDFVIHYNRRPQQTRTQAKKTVPGVKYYSDLH